jgi:2-keto-3-deoxy-L-rhamnonate aldolase RhmA
MLAISARESLIRQTVRVCTGTFEMLTDAAGVLSLGAHVLQISMLRERKPRWQSARADIYPPAGPHDVGPPVWTRHLIQRGARARRRSS